MLPLPPHLPKEKASKHLDILTAVREVLLEGRTSQGLQCLPYRSLEQAARYSTVIDAAMKAMNVESYRALWDLLTTAFPGLAKTCLNVKGGREPVQARSAAKQIVGWHFVQFHTKRTIYDAHPLTRRVLDPDYQYLFTWEQIERNLFLDGGKIDPPMWIRSQKGITQLGAPRHPICYQLLMRTVCCTLCQHLQILAMMVLYMVLYMVQVGQVPRVMFYVFGHAVLGCLLLTTANGSQAGNNVQTGLLRWTDTLSPAVKRSIMQNKYGCCDEVVEELREKNPVKAEELFPADPSKLHEDNFNPQGFLVRLLQHIFHELSELVKLLRDISHQVNVKQLNTGST